MGLVAFGVDEEGVLTVRTKGTAEGVGLSARKAAVETACQAALEEVLGAMTNSSEMDLFKPVLRQASRYVSRYDLLRSDIVGTATEVEIDAHVLEKPLKHDVAAIMLPRLPRKPSVRVLLAEFIGPGAREGGPTFDVAEAVFRKPLEDFGFTVKGVYDLLDHYEAPQLVAIAEGDVPTTAAFARANSEDVVLVVPSPRHTRRWARTPTYFVTGRVPPCVWFRTRREGRDTLTASRVQSVDPVEGAHKPPRMPAENSRAIVSLQSCCYAGHGRRNLGHRARGTSREPAGSG